MKEDTEVQKCQTKSIPPNRFVHLSKFFICFSVLVIVVRVEHQETQNLTEQQQGSQMKTDKEINFVTR